MCSNVFNELILIIQKLISIEEQENRHLTFCTFESWFNSIEILCGSFSEMEKIDSDNSNKAKNDEKKEEVACPVCGTKGKRT